MKTEDEERIKRIEKNQEADAFRINELQRQMNVILKTSVFGVLIDMEDRLFKLQRRLDKF